MILEGDKLKLKAEEYLFRYQSIAYLKKQYMEIRAERLKDISSVRKVNVAAFEREKEADLVNRLRGVASYIFLRFGRL